MEKAQRPRDARGYFWERGRPHVAWLPCALPDAGVGGLLSLIQSLAEPAPGLKVWKETPPKRPSRPVPGPSFPVKS